jgi:transaldolase
MNITDGTTAATGRLRALGQSVWIDDLTRDMIAGGDLVHLRESGVTGITANPTTFDKAVTGSSVYDADIRRLAGHRAATGILWDLLVDDVRHAAAVFRQVYDRTGGADGFVSIEVAPDIAADTEATTRMARELWERCDSPNVLVKVPATAQGVPAMRRLLEDGVNVNATLIFSVERYREVAEAYLSALEARRERGRPIDRVASVASFFVSRVDTKVDGELKRRLEGAEGEERERLGGLLGTIGVANSRHAFERFRGLFSGERWDALAAGGARPQRCLWASTSAKDPSFPATKYVEALAGPDTVDTMPLETFEALAGASLDGPALERDLDAAREQLSRLDALGIDLRRITAELETEGVRSFEESYRHLGHAIDEKVTANGWDRVQVAGEHSFPASDAPGSTGDTIEGAPARRT